MNTISLVSSIAMAVGLAASLPQIVRMLRTRSSGGQSVLGWAMGLITNLSMAYVNLFGFGAAALMASNLLSATLCVAAMLLIVRFGSGQVDLDPAPAAFPDHEAVELRPAHDLGLPVGALSDHRALASLPTTEFVALHDAVLSASDQRRQRSDERRVRVAA